MASKLSKLWAKGNKFDLAQNSDINVTPFVDVMLVLLIIFMVSAPLATIAIKVDLPPPADTPPPEKKSPVIINIQPTGLYLNTTPVQWENLTGALAGALGLPECSMGMSGDWQEAAAAGSTWVRIGSGLFGPRQIQ